MNILIVDDDFISRKLLKNILKEFGNVDIASNGKEAVDAYKNSIYNDEVYDLIMLDIMMDGIDGFETLDLIRKFEESKDILGYDGVKVIISSSLSDKKNIMRAFRKQSEGYLIKPIDKENLIKKLEELSLL